MAVAAAGSAPWLLRAGLAAAVLLLCPLTCRTPWRVSSRSTARLRPGRTSSTSAARGCLSSRRTPSSLSLLQMPASAAEVRCVDLRRAPWRTATASAACHGGPPRALLAGSARGHHGRARGGVQPRWYPAPAVPTTCSTPHPRTPASRAASAAGIHGQDRFELSYLGGGRSKWWTGSRVSSSAARLDVSPSRTVSRSLSESKSLRVSAPSVSPCRFWGSGMAPRWPASGGRRYCRFVRAWKFGSCRQYRSPLPSHTAPTPVAEESILLHQTPSEI